MSVLMGIPLISILILYQNLTNGSNIDALYVGQRVKNPRETILTSGFSIKQEKEALFLIPRKRCSFLLAHTSLLAGLATLLLRRRNVKDITPLPPHFHSTG